MAVKVKTNAEADKQFIYFYDETGKYNASCNDGGYGSPNIEVSDIDAATVEVFPPEATESEGILIDVYNSLPNDQKIGFEISADDLGLQEIKSGVWKFVYRVSSTSQNFSEEVSLYKYFDEVIACCVDSMMLDVSGGDFTSEANKKRIEMVILLDSARWAACKGDLNTAQMIANHISLQCKCCKH